MTKESMLLDVTIGNFVIKNVPHVKLSYLNAAGETVYRDILVDMKVSDIFMLMRIENRMEVNYDDYEESINEQF